MRLYWFKLLGVLTALVLAVVFYGQYYVWLVARNSIQRTVAKPESLDKDLIGHLQFYGSHEDQKKSSTAKLRNIISMKEDEPLACPSSLQLRAKEDSLYKTLFNFDIPLLMWDSHMTESNWQVLSKRPVPYGWKDLPREDVSSTLKLLNDSANQMMFEFKPPQSCVRCAVVGNGGILNGSRKGKEIDEHDYVFRQNGAITKGFEEDVGTKTSFYGFTVNTMKNSLIAYEADGFLSTPKGEAIQYIFIPSDLRDYVMLRSAIMGVPVPTGTDKGDMPSLYFSPETSPKKFKLLHPEFLLYTRDRFLPSEILKTEYARLYMPSTGGLMLLSALHSCDQVSAYGFITRSYNLYSDHYYEKKKQKLEFYANHDLLMEMKLWETLHKKGIMKLYQRGQDNDKEGET